METIGKIILTLAIIAAIIIILPASPVQDMINEVGELPFLAEINWLIPIHKMYVVTLIWLGCIGIYYTVSWLLRELSIQD